MKRLARYFAIVVLMLTIYDVAYVGGSEPLLRRRAQWRFFDWHGMRAELHRRQWRELNFDDTQWRQGQGLIGYGDADIATEISYGSDPQQKPPAALFRSRFACRRQALASAWIGGRICCDDGAAVFVNGHEVYRFNLPAGTVRETTYACRAIGPAHQAERVWRPFRVPATHLHDGENIVAVSVHQVNSTSGDLAMGLELFALNSSQEIEAFRSELMAAPNDVAHVSPVRLQAGTSSRFKLVTD